MARLPQSMFYLNQKKKKKDHDFNNYIMVKNGDMHVRLSTDLESLSCEMKYNERGQMKCLQDVSSFLSVESCNVLEC